MRTSEPERSTYYRGQICLYTDVTWSWQQRASDINALAAGQAIYAEYAVLEYLPSGERFHGRRNLHGQRGHHPPIDARTSMIGRHGLDFRVFRVSGKFVRKFILQKMT
jgi:hypothetical protein